MSWRFSDSSTGTAMTAKAYKAKMVGWGFILNAETSYDFR